MFSLQSYYFFLCSAGGVVIYFSVRIIHPVTSLYSYYTFFCQSIFNRSNRTFLCLCRALKAEVEQEAALPPTYTAAELGLTPLKKRDKLRQGEKVVVCSGSSLGWEGEVVAVSPRFFFFLRNNAAPPPRSVWPAMLVLLVL